jgi:hypothetical protein
MGMKQISIENYTLGAQFCRSTYVNGGVAIFVHDSLKASNIDLSKYSKGKDIEISVVKLHLGPTTLCTITIYRAPSGNFSYFLQNPENALQSLSTPNSNIIISGDINVNYLVESEQKNLLHNAFLMYNLIGTVDFRTRINSSTTSAIDNVLIDISCFAQFSVVAFPNDISDHDAQILTIKGLPLVQSDKSQSIRKVDKYTISDFIYKLSNESWNSVFDNNDGNLKFNSFLSIYLRIFYSSFPLVRIKRRQKKNQLANFRHSNLL